MWIDMKVKYYVKADKIIDEKKYSRIPEVFRELTKKDLQVTIVREQGDKVVIDTEYGIREVNKTDLILI
jgi:hypothetical protein